MAARKFDENYTNAKLILIETHMKEYSFLREEILQLIKHRYNAINYSLIVLASLIAFLPTAVTNFGDYILLFSTLPFFGLAWYIITIDSSMARISFYLKTSLIPKLNNLIHDNSLTQKGISEEIQKIMEWENFTTSFVKRRGLRNAITLLLSGGRNIIVVGPIPVLVSIFVYKTRFVALKPWNIQEQILFWCNVAFMLLFVLVAALVRAQFSTSNEE